MTFNEADNGLANIFNDRNNCASCVIAHELRLRGFDLSAVAYDPTKGSSAQLLSENTLRAWKRESGKPVQFDARLGGSLEKIRGKLEKMTRAIGSRYHISWDGRFQDYGHIITAERTEKGLIFYDPQRNRTWSLEEIEADMKQGSCLEILRVDRLLLDIDNLAGLFMGGLQQPQ